MAYLMNPFLMSPFLMGPTDGPSYEHQHNKPFKIHWEPPEGIEMEDPLLPDPRDEKLIRDVGVQNIVDALSVEVLDSQLVACWNGQILEELLPEQRQVITSHLAHILNNYMYCDSREVRDYMIKTTFHYEVQMLAQREGEPGEF